MKLPEAIRIAVANRDARMAGRIAEQLRARGGTYASIAAFAAQHAGCSAADWEALMYEADEATEEE